MAKDTKKKNAEVEDTARHAVESFESDMGDLDIVAAPPKVIVLPPPPPEPPKSPWILPVHATVGEPDAEGWVEIRASGHVVRRLLATGEGRNGVTQNNGPYIGCWVRCAKRQS